MVAALLTGLLLTGSAQAQAPLAISVGPTGVIQDVKAGGDVVARDIGMLVVKPGWNGTWADQRKADPAKLKVEQKDARTEVSGTIALEGGSMDFQESVSEVKEGVKLSYAIRPSVDLQAEGVVLSVILPAPAAAGTGKWYAWDGMNLRSALFPAEKPEAYHLVGGAMEWLGWTLPSGQGLKFDLTQSTTKSLNLQDDRQWNTPNFELHLPVPGTNTLKAGQQVAFELLLQPFTAQDAQREEAALLEARKAQAVKFESAEPLRLGPVSPPKAPVAQFERTELTLELGATYDNPFDPAQIDVTATFTGPDGKALTVPGFFYVPYERTEVNGKEKLTKTGPPVWKVRFTPTASGRYECTVRAKDRTGEVQSKPVRFTVQPKAERGFVRRSEKSPYYLRFDSGEPYFAVGENVCWGGDRQTLDYDKWFSHLGQAGGNYARIWLVRWNMGLEWSDKDTYHRGQYPGLGRYSPDNAWRLDYVMDLAEKTGIYTMLCLGYHGELLDQKAYFGEQCWDFNPYNQANGGPCAKPVDFWTNEQARKLYQQRLRYYIARWGAYTNVLSFEFWNEVLAPAPWVGEMAKYMRANDPFGHLVTTTYGDDAVWRLPEMDYSQTHMYGTGDQLPDCVAAISSECREHTEKYRKPHMVGEFGIDWQKGDNDHDPQGLGTNLHNGLWASLASRGMGGASIWYWDGYVEPKNLYHEFTALAQFAKDVKWPELDFRLAETSSPLRAPKPGEPWRDVELRPGTGWGKATGTEFTIESDGRLTGKGSFAQFLYSPGKPNERAPLRFHVACPQGGKLTMHVGTVSARAVLQVLIDGQVAWQKEFKAGPAGEGEYKETKYQEQWKLWQSLYDRDYTVDLPAGTHAVDLNNQDGDWIEVGRYRFTGCVDPRFVTQLDILGLTTDDYAIVWIHNRESNWYNQAHGTAVEPVRGATFTLKGLRDGEYVIEWWDTKTGTKARDERVKCAGGALTVAPGDVATDVACKVKRATK